VRRTLATGLQRFGVRLEVTEAVLNHLSGSRAGVVGIYQRHDWAEEKRAALDAWSAHVLAAAEGRLTAVKVLPFSRAGSGEEVEIQTPPAPHHQSLAKIVSQNVGMRISIDARERDFEPALNWIGSLVGAALDKRVASFEAQERKNPLLATHFRETFALEFALAKARKYRRNTGRLPKGDEYDLLYGFVIPAQRIHAALPPNVRMPFEGRLHDAVNGAYGTRPFAYEISIATHLMQKGWDVEFADYAGIGRFDFLARQGAVEIEIECKSTSGDTGRKIHRQEVNRLADLLLRTTERLADIAGCHRILVTIPDRLGKSNEALSGIASIAAQAAEQKGAASSGLARAEYTFDNIASWPQPGRDADAKSFFETRFGFSNAHLLFHGRPNFSVVAVMIRSEKADTLVDALSNAAKEAADQCSGTRSALVAMHLIDQISRPELQSMLRTPNGLHAVMHALLRSGKRQHVDSVAFTVPQSIRPDGIGARRLSGDLIVLNNPQPLFPCDEIRSIFRSS